MKNDNEEELVQVFIILNTAQNIGQLIKKSKKDAIKNILSDAMIRAIKGEEEVIGLGDSCYVLNKSIIGFFFTDPASMENSLAKKHEMLLDEQIRRLRDGEEWKESIWNNDDEDDYDE